MSITALSSPWLPTSFSAQSSLHPCPPSPLNHPLLRTPWALLSSVPAQFTKWTVSSFKTYWDAKVPSWRVSGTFTNPAAPDISQEKKSPLWCQLNTKRAGCHGVSDIRVKCPWSSEKLSNLQQNVGYQRLEVWYVSTMVILKRFLYGTSPVGRWCCMSMP